MQTANRRRIGAAAIATATATASPLILPFLFLKKVISYMQINGFAILSQLSVFFLYLPSKLIPTIR